MITVKRETGLLGATSKLRIVLDGGKSHLIKNNQELTIPVGKDEVEFQAKQMGLKSPKVRVAKNEHIVIRMNMKCVLLYFLLLMSFYATMAIQVTYLKVIFSVVCMSVAVLTLFYGMNHAYAIQKETPIKDEKQ